MQLENALTITIGMMMIGVAIYYFFSKKPVTIYNQDKPPQAKALTNVKSYNHATALLMFIYGLIFIGEGILINDQMFCLIIAILTVMPGLVVIISLYETVILKRFIKR